MYGLPPASFQINALLARSDGVGNPVDFYFGTNKVGTVVDPPYVLSVTNLPAGEYNLRVGTTNAAGMYTLFPPIDNYYMVRIIEPSFVQPRRPDSNTFTFDFTKTLTYGTNVIEVSTDLRSWLPIATNEATTSSFSFRDDSATNALSRFYRAKVFPWGRLLP